MQLSTLAKRGSLILFFVVAAFYLYGLGHLPLLGPDEPRYAQIAREMYTRADLITPTLGGHPWFEKPALLYWMMIASYKLFGVTEWTARLPAAVAGLLTVGAVFFVGRSVSSDFRRTKDMAEPSDQRGTNKIVCPTDLGFWSALAAATTLGIVVFARAASFDIIVTMTIAWALAFFLVSELTADSHHRRRLLFGFYVFVGLSLLAKGLIGIVIPLGIVGLYSLFRRRLPERKVLMSVLWGVPLSLAVASLWYAPVIWRHGWPFVDQFFIQHQFARYVSNRYRHPAPVYFYLLILIPLTLPWTAFIIDEIRGSKPWQRKRAEDPTTKLLNFAFAWLLFPLLFFSFSTSKLPGYILPVLPAMTLLAGYRLSRISFSLGEGKWALRITAAVSMLLAGAVPIFAWRTGHPALLCAGIIATCLGVAGVLLLISRNRCASLIVTAAALGVVLVVLHCWAPQSAEHQTAKHLLQLADQRGFSQTLIYGLQRDDRTPEFYAGGRVIYGSDQEPIMFESQAPAIAESLRRKEPLLVFVPLSELASLVEESPEYIDVIGDNGRIALIVIREK
ncbi:MAG TPA: glycosyltransferase family 39 protein [Pyrinomonadaceae bacterium]|nr:glycosyltransferase family 39 protein [Pyrinomonadaceae bacterium]